MLDFPELLVPARSASGRTAISVRLRMDLNPSTAMAEIPPDFATGRRWARNVLDLSATLLLRASRGHYFHMPGDRSSAPSGRPAEPAAPTHRPPMGRAATRCPRDREPSSCRGYGALQPDALAHASGSRRSASSSAAHDENSQTMLAAPLRKIAAVKIRIAVRSGRRRPALDIAVGLAGSAPRPSP